MIRVGQVTVKVYTGEANLRLDFIPPCFIITL